jgi:serine protease Do
MRRFEFLTAFHAGWNSQDSQGHLFSSARSSMFNPGSFQSLRLPGFLFSPRCLLWGLCLTFWTAIGQLTDTSRAQDNIADQGLAAALALEQASMNAIEKAERSIVAISRARRNAPPADASPQFSPLTTPDNPDFVPTLYGSGVVISEDGYIVTCAHVLDDPRQHDYFVWLDKEFYPARVIGYSAKVLAADPFSDLAVLKIDASNLKRIEFGVGRELRKGQFVIALGNPYATARDGEASASWGIVSNLKRVAPSESETSAGAKETIHQLGMLIQTDAKLTLGTSGGALVNLRGEMIGLTTSLAATSGYEQSAGFAIAVDEMFLRVVDTLKLGQLPSYGFLGIQPEDVSAIDRARGIRGARVTDVIQGLPGEKAGLLPRDVIIEVDTETIHNRSDLFRELSRGAAGQVVTLRVQRSTSTGAVPEILTLQAELSKKYVAVSRPGYAMSAPSAWRGVDVEYATAVPPEISRSDAFSGRRGAKLAVLAVMPGSQSWKAGLRPGYGIQAVRNTPVETPDDFYQAIAGLNDSVDLTVLQIDGRSQKITVEAE